MRTRSVRGGSVLVVAAAVVAALVASASGAVRSSPPRAWTYPGGESQRLAYEHLNRLTEELRQEVNRTEPHAAVVADMKARLRLLANRPSR